MVRFPPRQSPLPLGVLTNIIFRRTLSAADRKAFIAAVKCVQAKPSTFPPGQAAGAKSLYDDFVALHLLQTPFIHLSVSL
jgi:tyrosinase